MLVLKYIDILRGGSFPSKIMRYNYEHALEGFWRNNTWRKRGKFHLPSSSMASFAGYCSWSFWAVESVDFPPQAAMSKGKSSTVSVQLEILRTEAATWDHQNVRGVPREPQRLLIGSVHLPENWKRGKLNYKPLRFVSTHFHQWTSYLFPETKVTAAVCFRKRVFLGHLSRGRLSSFSVILGAKGTSLSLLY